MLILRVPLTQRSELFFENKNRIGFPYRFAGNNTMYNTENSTSSANDTPVLVFVKFHKVAGTAVACDILKHLQLTYANENYYVCATHYCSLSIARLLRKVVTDSRYDHSNHTIHIQKRNALLGGTDNWVGPGHNQNTIFPPLPSNQSYPNLKIKFMTILRDPLERIRSKYYFRRGSAKSPGWCAKRKSGCLASNSTFLDWLKYYDNRKLSTKDELEICCEYTKVLGGIAHDEHNITEAIRTLELFDMIGDTDNYGEFTNAAFEELGILDPNQSKNKNMMRDNNAVKKSWTTEEREIAERITAGDRKIFAPAQKLMRKRHTTIT